MTDSLSVPENLPVSALDLFPSLDRLDFSQNCDAYGRWLASVLTADPWMPNTTYMGSISLSIDLLTVALPANFNNTAGGAWTNDATSGLIWGNMLEWWTEQLYGNVTVIDGESYLFATDAILQRAIYDPREKCPKEFCKAIAYKGNGDTAGIGVFVSYYMEASLATVYLIAFTIWNIRRYFEKKKARQAMQSGRPHINRTFTGLGNVGGRVLDAFRGSLDPLLGATVLMAIVMFVAAIYTAAMGAKKREVPVNLQAIPTGSALYDVSLSFLAGTFSAFPVLLLYALTKQPDRRSEASHRKWLRRVGLVIVWGLGVAETFLAPRGEIDYEVRHEADKAENHIDCDERGGASYWAGLKAAQFLVCAIPGLWIVLTVFLVTGFGSKAVVKNPFVRRFRAVWRLVVAWVNLIIMWLVLLYFTRLRTDIITRADGLDNTDEWGFGQILAVSTWVPAILEFLYILIFGLEDSLSGRMPENYYVAHVTPNGEVVGGPPNEVKMPLMHGNTLYDPSASHPSLSQQKGFTVEAHALSMPPTPYDNQAAAYTPPPQQETPWRQLQNTGW